MSWGLCGRQVLVEKSSQAALASDPIWRHRERDHVRVVVWGAQIDTLALMAAARVVVVHVAVQDAMEMPGAGDEDPVGQVTSNRVDPAFGEGVHSWRLRCGEHRVDTDGREYRSEGRGELRITITDQVSEPVSGILEIGREIVGQLNRPLPRRMCGHPE